MSAEAAFFDAGYDVQDAARLAELWGNFDLVEVRAEAGSALLAGQELPFAPEGCGTGA